MDHEREFPLSAIMAHEEIQHGPWRVPRWRLVGFVAGEALERDGSRAQLIRSEGGCEQWLWTGFRLRLYRDSAESYWYNLVGEVPSLFLICQRDPAGELIPLMVTANQAEASSHMEADDEVFSAPIPPEVHRWIEQYVMDNFNPGPRKQRRRMPWTKEAPEHGQRPFPRAPRRH